MDSINQKQKIIIPSDFQWVTDDFRRKHNAWLLKMFGMDDYNKAVIEYARTEKPVSIKRRKRRLLSYEIEGKSYNTLGELLDGIDGTFDSLRFPDDKLSWLPKDQMRAIRKIGVHVPNPWVLDTRLQLGNVKDFPTIMAIGISRKSSKNDENFSSPVLMFAIRQNNFPSGIEIKDGIPYLFGECFNLDGKNLWVAMYVTVTSSGKVSMCKQLQVDRVPIHHKHTNNGRRVTYISQKRWTDSSLLHERNSYSENEVKQFTEAAFINMFHWWSHRDERWSVGIRHDGNRVTFGVEPENTKLYFADRDKTIKAADGKAKRIIHYVSEHERVLANGSVSTVKEHIRGIREFDWNKYHCIVSSPKFHNKTAALFCIEPIDIDDETNTNKNTISTNKLARLLANFEDYGRTKSSFMDERKDK